MNLYFPLQRYLDKLNDTKFISVWEKLVVRNFLRFGLTVFFIFLFITMFLGFAFTEMFGFFLALFLVMFFGFFFGYTVIVQSIRFLAENNKRYMLAKMNIDQNNSGINYDNVVG